mmetsp:Transcript_33033/g.48506  ORF Transcript_33033/g.48506 Transcript_33033/m.48506 type:complete len:81 (+) Transcript_33033:1510-1752(+)
MTKKIKMIMTIIIDNDNAYSLSAAAATKTSAMNRRGGGYREYKDEPDYNYSQVQHNDDDGDDYDDEFGLMDSTTVWTELC